MPDVMETFGVAGQWDAVDTKKSRRKTTIYTASNGLGRMWGVNGAEEALLPNNST